MKKIASYAGRDAHFAWASGETVLQVHGMGPFEINYCHPEDDSRHKK